MNRPILFATLLFAASRIAGQTPSDGIIVRALAIRAVHPDTTPELLLVGADTTDDRIMDDVAKRLGKKAKRVGKNVQPGVSELKIGASLVSLGNTSAQVRVTLVGTTRAARGRPSFPFAAGHLVTLRRGTDGTWQVVSVLEEWIS